MTEAIKDHADYELDPIKISEELVLKFLLGRNKMEFFEIHYAELEWQKLPGYDKEHYSEKKSKETSTFYLKPTDADYVVFLWRKILVVDVAKIPSLLTYQLNKYWKQSEADKHAFIDKMEYEVYPLIAQHNYLKETERNIQAMNWVHAHRMEKPKSFKREFRRDKQKEFNRKYRIQHNVFHFSPEFTYKLIEELAVFFPKQKRNLTSAILKNESTERLKFHGKSNQLAELFHRIKNSKASIGKSTYDDFGSFLERHFCYCGPDGIYISFSASSIITVMRNKEKHAKGINVILPELLKDV